ncbi:MAG: hypothetical protein WAX14_04780 [Rhodococcus sp. (in: high G+C Gram-positive bacteria)]|uniref:hypothetical protein n=1 Tax=Rhodococcus sp. TaxID=1831 RepID=UPI003BB6318C
MASSQEGTAVVRSSRCAATFNRDEKLVMHSGVHGEFLTVASDSGRYTARAGDTLVGAFTTEADAMIAAVESVCSSRHHPV